VDVVAGTVEVEAQLAELFQNEVVGILVGGEFQGVQDQGVTAQ